MRWRALCDANANTGGHAMTSGGYGVQPHDKRGSRSENVKRAPSRARLLRAMDAASRPDRPVFIYLHMQNLHYIGGSL
ncbi:MAG: hypothetical protein RL682_898 [Pseudomonadota bacterium]|jgi:hypothetical protein